MEESTGDQPALLEYELGSTCNLYNVSWIPNRQSHNIDRVNLNIDRIGYFLVE